MPVFESLNTSIQYRKKYSVERLGKPIPVFDSLIALQGFSKMTLASIDGVSRIRALALTSGLCSATATIKLASLNLLIVRLLTGIL